MVTPKTLLYETELRAVRPRRNFSRPVVYTNDLNSAEFQFKITDMDAGELSTATATTLLYMRDGSFFQNPKEDVRLVGTTFSYTLKENEGNHGGLAQIQLVVTVSGMEFATHLFDFEIINGLETKVAQEVMIYDWTTLTRDARAFLDAVELAEAGRVTKESQRVTAESNRVTAEGNRVTAESGRVTAESGRVTAETNRAAAFTAFNTRLTAEETATANNKISAVKGKTFADVDARLEDLEFDTTIMGTNLVTNGDFASGITGWSATGGTIRAENGQLILNEGATSAEHYAQTDLSAPLLNNVYYFRGSSSNGATISLYNRKSDGSYESLSRPFVGGVASGRITTSTIFATPGMFLRVHGKSGVYLGANLEYRFDDVMVLNLTAIFGSGNEPTTEQIDRLLTQFPNSWFSGTKNLFLAKSALKEFDTVLMATNRVLNGEFTGLTGWSAIYASLSAASNVLSITGDGTNATPRAYQITTGKITANTKIYATQLIKVTNALCTNITVELKSDPTLSALGVFGSVTSPTKDVAYRLSGIVQAPAGYDNNNIVLFARNTYADAATASGKIMQWSVPIVLNLTEIFGVGNEPTSAQMDRLLTQFPNSWFTGTKNLFLAKWALNELRRLDNDKANKAQGAWITPTLVNGATGTFQYRKNEFGRLEFKGELTQASIASYFAITIAGYRPPAWVRCPITSIDGVVSMLVISDGGALYLHTPLAGKTISFSGISINIQ